MTNQETISLIASTIKNRKKDVVSFIQKNGGVIKNSDSHVAIGKELSKVLTNNAKAQKEFVDIMNPSNAGGTDPYTAAISTVAKMFTTSSEKKIAEQQGSDAITLALINNGISKQTTSWPLVISLVVMGVVVIIIGILVFKKYNK